MNQPPHSIKTSSDPGCSTAVQSPEVWWACQRCTNCCKWPGQVRLQPQEIVAIAAYLGMSEWEFIQTHTRLQASRTGLSLIEKEDGACEFLDGKDCRLQEVKPQQCKDFPNGWNFPGWQEVCEAIPVARTQGSATS